MKEFVWRATLNCIPTRLNLRCRLVEVDKICPVCRMEAEDSIYNFVNRPIAIDVWSSSGVSFL